MKFECTIEIKAPVAFVAEHFANRENLVKWHLDLDAVKQLEGAPGEPASKSLLKFRNFEIIETVLKNELPDEFLGDYETPGICHNTMSNQFKSLGALTQYVVVVDYTKLNWFLKVMSVLTPWVIKGQVKKYQKKFKSVVEAEYTDSGPPE